MKQSVLLILLVLLTGIVQVPLCSRLSEKPLAEKVGFSGNPFLLVVASFDQKEAIGALLSFRTLYYYGAIVEKQYNIPVDYDGISRLMATAIRLDPYNSDPYYFSQAVLTWDAGYVAGVVDVLKNGMKYRTWDWMLPFWAGFDSANFLKDYNAAAMYYGRAAELSGADIFSRLASRYFYEANQTDHAIQYLEAMIRSATKPAIRKSFEIRLESLRGVKAIEVAADLFYKQFGKKPSNLDELLEARLLDQLPGDPHGGKFYLDKNGRVRLTSLFQGHKDKNE